VNYPHIKIFNSPGGTVLSKRAIELSDLSPNARVLDIGCGSGETVAMMRNFYKFAAVGLEKDQEIVRAANRDYIVHGDGAALPFAEASLDAVFFGCSFSKMDKPDRVLSECKRCLNAGDPVILTDVYALQNGSSFSGILGRIETKIEIIARFKKADFELSVFEDHSPVLREAWGQYIFDNGIDALYKNLGAGEKELDDVKCGYFLAIFKHAGYDRERLLEETISYAKKNSPFYRKRLGEAVGFNKLPFTYPEDIAQNGPSMLCISSGEAERIVSLDTSTSTGPAKRLFFSKSDLARTVVFFARGMVDVLGNSKNAIIFMSGKTENSVAVLLQKGLGRIGACSEIYGNIKDIADAGKMAHNFDCYIGLPGEMIYLCRAFPALSPKSVLLSGDYVPKSVVKSIEEIWNCKVFTHYGLTETCYGLAVECGCRLGQHIRDWEFIVEIINPQTGETLLPGNKGEIVVTSLKNEAMPLIRYRTGDMGVMADGDCGCGENSPRLLHIYGRVKNLEKELNIHALDEYMYAIPGLRNYTAEIKNESLYLCVDGPELDTEEISGRLKTGVIAEYRELPPFTVPGKRRIKEVQCCD
jgi:phenylacetate-coenzyme A ligase PaaK-like adenylate-forming protein/precorrin-6B methylase 2